LKLSGSLREGTTATDLVLTVTQMLRAKGVVGKFVEFYGPGLNNLSLADQATISNMAPEYGATCGFFPVDRETCDYLAFTGRGADQVALVEAYAKAQGMWRDAETPDPVFTDTIELDISTVEASLAGPKRPQDRVTLSNLASEFEDVLPELGGGDRSIQVAGADYELSDGDVVIAAITSCTNTSNPSVMVAAGLVARNARAKGLRVKPWVKTSLAPGSQVVSDYLEAAGLQDDLDALGFHLVGYGCTTCIGNSGPLPDAIADAVDDGDLVVGAVLSGNRNFEGRVNRAVRANYLASPPLVVAYALAGRMDIDLYSEPLGEDRDGRPVMLRDIWPSTQDVQRAVASSVKREMFAARYGAVLEGSAEWRAIRVPEGLRYSWPDSTYILKPSFFDGMTLETPDLTDITDARVLALLGDSVTTDHISPAGLFPADGPAGQYLIEMGVDPVDFNSFGARRGNHEVMKRGTFANIRLRNQLAPGTEGGFTRYFGATEEVTTIFDASERYRADGVPLVVLAGKEYGTGSSRDWAAKGTMLLGVRAVITASFERIHRSNLVMMGVLPLEFEAGQDAQSLGLSGSERFSIRGISSGLTPRQLLGVTAVSASGETTEFEVRVRIDTPDEVEYYRHGGILNYVLRQMAAD